MTADFHTAFNLVLAIIFILPLGWLASLLDPVSARTGETQRSRDTAVSG